MQWPPTRPGWKGRKFHLVPAASSTSQIDRSSRAKIWVISFMKAMLMSRWAFSITLAASAALIEAARNTPALGHRAVDRGEPVGDRLVLAGDDLHDPVDRMLAVARIDPLGRVAEEEVAAPDQARNLLDQRPANLLGDAGIDGAFIDDDRLPGRIEQRGDGAGRADHRAEIGLVGLVDRRRDGDDVDVGAGAVGRIGGERQAARPRAPRARPRGCGRCRASSSAIRPLVDVEAGDLGTTAPSATASGRPT